MRRMLGLVACLMGYLAGSASTTWAQGWFIGGNLGASEPSNKNYRGHVTTGFTINPYAGYMFTRYIGAQAGVHFFYQGEDNHIDDPRGFFYQSRQATTMMAGTAGPRLNLPLGDLIDTAFLRDLDIYAAPQGGYFVGLSGRLSQSAPGFTAGGGINYHLSEELGIGPYAYYNRAYMGPRPHDLGPGQVPDERFSTDIEWITAGLSANYQFPPPKAVATPAPVIATSPPILPSPTHRKIVLRSVYFEFDRYNIRPDAQPVLDEAAGLLRDQGDISIAAEGHTDGIGTDTYNMALGRRRANAVRGYLINKGINPSRITTESYGESNPVASNETIEGRAQNRRVELRVEDHGRGR